MNLEEGCVNIWRRHHQYEDTLRYVQKAPNDICWTIDRTEFDDRIALKDSAPGPNGIPYSAYKCSGQKEREEGDWDPSSCSTPTSIWWQEVRRLHSSLDSTAEEVHPTRAEDQFNNQKSGRATM